jgi:alpha-1,3-glucosyltransferase
MNFTREQVFWAVVLTVLFSLLIRYAVSLEGYSGYNKPPMYGDYEAQRHWMEITLNLPVREWYVNTERNNLTYWGLDYPPLTAYHSLLNGYIAQLIEPQSVTLKVSEGYESATHKLFMRTTVIVSEFIIYFSSVFVFVFWSFYRHDTAEQKLTAIAVILLQPALILIDHGHFQYNSVSLGFVVWAVVLVMEDYDVLGSVAFCLALNYKQMSLYFAPTFFVYLLRKTFNAKRHKIMKFLQVGSAVVLTFALCWIPFLTSYSPLVAVLRRIFPKDRGLFEDKVANFWCAISPLIKVKTLLSVDTTIVLCAMITFIAFLPSNILLFLNPHKENFLRTLFTTAMSFFLFSFQVHEKSILLPLLPATLLCLRQPKFTAWQVLVSTFSMSPLLFKDGLALGYIILMLGTLYLYFFILNWGNLQLYILSILIGVWHIVSSIVRPPSRYPDLLTLLLMAFCFTQFMAGSLFMINIQFVEWRHRKQKLKEKAN